MEQEKESYILAGGSAKDFKRKMVSKTKDLVKSKMVMGEADDGELEAVLASMGVDPSKLKRMKSEAKDRAGSDFFKSCLGTEEEAKTATAAQKEACKKEAKAEFEKLGGSKKAGQFERKVKKIAAKASTEVVDACLSMGNFSAADNSARRECMELAKEEFEISGGDSNFFLAIKEGRKDVALEAFSGFQDEGLDDASAKSNTKDLLEETGVTQEEWAEVEKFIDDQKALLTKETEFKEDKKKVKVMVAFDVEPTQTTGKEITGQKLADGFPTGAKSPDATLKKSKVTLDSMGVATAEMEFECTSECADKFDPTKVKETTALKAGEAYQVQADGTKLNLKIPEAAAGRRLLQTTSVYAESEAQSSEVEVGQGTEITGSITGSGSGSGDHSGASNAQVGLAATFTVAVFATYIL